MKKMMWVPKGSTPNKAELITRISTARTTLKSEPHMTFKVLLSKHTNKKADPWSHDRTWSSQRKPRGWKIVSGYRDHWWPHHQFSLFNAPMYGQGDSHPGMCTCFSWFGYSPLMHYDEFFIFCLDCFKGIYMWSVFMVVSKLITA
jgi:hypothetical protein